VELARCINTKSDIEEQTSEIMRNIEKIRGKRGEKKRGKELLTQEDAG
jgi:hypothetical protein